MKKLSLSLIRIYQRVGFLRFLSGVLPVGNCRFKPTCSKYTHQAITRYGIIRGGLMGLRRLSRCHPLNPGGFDPVI